MYQRMLGKHVDETPVPHDLPSLEAESPSRVEESSLHTVPSLHKDVGFFHAVLRHRWIILGLTFSGIVCGLLSQFTAQPVYEARTLIEIQPISNDFMDTRSVSTSVELPGDAILQTQINLLNSESLADQVKTELSAVNHPLVFPRTDLLSRLEGALHLRVNRATAYDKLLEETSKNVRIKRLGISQLIEVTCTSWDAAFAARYCNTLTSQYQEIDLEGRGTQAKRISDWLMRQAADVRQKADNAQQRLEVAAGANGMLQISSIDSIGEERLAQMQTELVRAQADRMQKQGELAEAESGASDVSPDSTAKLHEGYQAARHREELLNLTYQNIEGSISSDPQKKSEVDTLRREVRAEQRLYQVLLQRVKEAGFASALPSSTIRIVDMAKVPSFPVYPRRRLAVIAGGMLGSILGLLVAFLIEKKALRLRLPMTSLVASS
jgi:uncharacterized protein involved in exopolysaccharide biosynthesis